MSGATLLVVVFLVCLIGWAVFRVIRKSQKGGGCCGEHEAAPKRLPVEDRIKSHYPHKVILQIGGMTCENCAIRVENALNVLPGTWAKVDIADKKATVLLKEEPDIKQLRRAVSGAGYTVLGER